MIAHRHGLSSKLVALTFDDGPSQWTDAILDLLVAHGGRATFFALGVAAGERKQTLRRIYECGSDVGNHTYAHRPLTALSDTEIVQDLNRTTYLLEAITGQELRYWRAPYFGADERVRRAAASTGLEEVCASVLPEDYNWPAEAIARFVLGQVQPGSIVDLHDGRPPFEPSTTSAPTRDATVEAVAIILPALAAEGFRSVTVAELVAVR